MKKKIFLKVFSLLMITSVVVTNFSIVNAEFNMQNNAITQNTVSYVSKNLNTNEETFGTFTTEDNQISAYSISNEIYGGVTQPYDPNPDLVQPFSIIGGDERTRVTNTTSSPFSKIAYLETRWPNGTATKGTGFLIYRDLALTAGHCVYDSKRGGWATSITIWPGRNGSSTPFGSTTAWTMHVATDWVNNNPNSDEDWALLELSSDMGNNTGWMGIAYSLDYSGFNGKNVTVAGYPGEYSQLMYQGIGPVRRISPLYLYYDVDATNGNSGSPVWDTSSGYVIGVHVLGTDPGGWNSCSNITKARFEFFVSLMN